MIEKITWIDSGMFIDHQWAELNVYQKSAKEWDSIVITVGTNIYEDEKVIVLGLTHDSQNDHWYGAQLIYKPCIIKREELEIANGKG